MRTFPFEMTSPEKELPALGLIVLQADETIESEFRRCLPAEECDLFVSRVPSGAEVTRETLGEMANHLEKAASLFPKGRRLAAAGYACTSGTSVIGIDRITELVRKGCDVGPVTNPLSAILSACQRRGIRKLALLSPYVESVSEGLRTVLATNGIETPVFGSFNESEEYMVVRISGASLVAAAKKLVKAAPVDGLFLSCTNLKTFEIIGQLEESTGLPVISSNSAMAEEMRILANLPQRSTRKRNA